jgi:hypothetical protein
MTAVAFYSNPEKSEFRDIILLETVFATLNRTIHQVFS